MADGPKTADGRYPFIIIEATDGRPGSGILASEDNADVARREWVEREQAKGTLPTPGRPTAGESPAITGRKQGAGPLVPGFGNTAPEDMVAADFENLPPDLHSIIKNIAPEKRQGTLDTIGQILGSFIPGGGMDTDIMSMPNSEAIQRLRGGEPTTLDDFARAMAGPDATPEQKLNTIQGHPDLGPTSYQWAPGKNTPEGYTLTLDHLAMNNALARNFGEDLIEAEFPGGAIRNYDPELKDIIKLELGGGKFQARTNFAPFSMSLVEMGAYMNRTQQYPFSPANMMDERDALLSQGIYARIASDPGRQGNSFLFARRSESEDWQPVNMGSWEETFKSLGTEVPATLIQIMSAMLGRKYGYPKIKDRFPSMGKFASRATKLGVETGAATLGGIAAVEAENKIYSAFFDQPEPTLQQRVNEAAEMAAYTVGGDVGIQGTLGILKGGSSRVLFKLSGDPEGLKYANQLAQELGFPPVLPGQLGPIAKTRMSRLVNFTPFGQRWATQQLSQVTDALFNLTNRIGNIPDAYAQEAALKRMSAQHELRGLEKAGKFREKGVAFTRKGRQKRADLATTAEQNALRDELSRLHMGIEDTKWTRWNPYTNAVGWVRESAKEMQGILRGKAGYKQTGDLRTVRTDARKAYTQWELNASNAFTKEADGIGEQLHRHGATWDLSAVQDVIPDVLSVQRGIPIEGGIIGGRKLTPEFWESDLGKKVLGISQLGSEVVSGNPGTFGTLRELMSELDNIPYSSLATKTEKDILSAYQKALRKAVYDPQFPADMTRYADNIPGQTPTFKRSEVLKVMNDSRGAYKEYLAAREMWGINTAIGLPPEDLVKYFISPRNKPHGVIDLHTMYKSAFSGEEFNKEWGKVTHAFANQVMSWPADDITKFLKEIPAGPEYAKARKLLMTPRQEIEMTKYARRKKVIVDDPKVIDLLSNMTEMGKQLVDAKVMKDEFAFSEYVQLITKAYGKENMQEMVPWAILTDVLNKSLVLRGGSLVINPLSAKKSLTELKKLGIFDGIMKPEDLNNLDKALLAIDNLPVMVADDTATGMALMARAGSSLPIPNPGQPLKTVDAWFGKMTDWLNARAILNGWVGAPIGMGKGGTELTRQSRYSIIQATKVMIQAQKAAEEAFPERGQHERTTSDDLRSMNNLNWVFVPGDSLPEQYDAARASQILMLMTLEDEKERSATQDILDAVTVESDPQKAVVDPATGDFPPAMLNF